MLDAKVHFVSALTSSEYDAYTDRVPHRALAAFEPCARALQVEKNNCEPSPTREAVRVRAVVYFNPQLFLDQRRRAGEQLKAIDAFAQDLNTRLASARSRMGREQIAAAVDRRLRKNDLLQAFELIISERETAGATRFGVNLSLKHDDWSRRRRYDGFNIVVAHPDLKLSAQELCRLYRAKDLVEKDFQTIKSFIQLRPIRHKTDAKVRAHVTICMLALLLKRTLQHKLKGKSTAEAALETLEGCRLNKMAVGENGATVYNLTEPTRQQTEILRTLGLQALADHDLVAEAITPR